MQDVREFLALHETRGNVDLPMVALYLAIGCVLSIVLGQIYVRYGRSPSDRRAFSRQFVLITMTTTLIIVVVKSSLALSLGLVGALSIVRFRSAVREHEELAYLFLAIALGLALGADQIPLALLGFGIVSVVLIGRGAFGGRVRHENLYLRVHGPCADQNALKRITDILCRSASMVKLKRCDLADETMESSFLVEFRSIDDLMRAQNELRSELPSVTVSVIDGDGLE